MEDINGKREEEAELPSSDLWALPIIQYAYERKKISDSIPKICKICNIEKPGTDFHYHNRVCKSCFNKKNRGKRKYISKFIEEPFKNHKDSGGYLGVHVAERVLSTVFEGVARCKTHNPGYDFVCKKNYKIDVKASCVRVNRGWRNWQFLIRKNKVPDYFLCLAFDSRESLNPEHLWLIPGEIVNNFGTIDISKQTLLKWSQYELPLSKVTDACEAFREGVKANV